MGNRSLREELALRTVSPAELIKEAEERGREEYERTVAAEKLAADKANAPSVKPIDKEDSTEKQAESVIGDIDKYINGELGDDKVADGGSVNVQDDPGNGAPRKAAGAEKTEPNDSRSSAASLIKSAMVNDALDDETRRTVSEKIDEQAMLTVEKVAAMDGHRLIREVEKRAMAFSPLMKKVLIGAGGAAGGAAGGSLLTRKKMNRDFENWMAADALRDQQEKARSYQIGQAAVIDKLRQAYAAQASEGGE